MTSSRNVNGGRGLVFSLRRALRVVALLAVAAILPCSAHGTTPESVELTGIHNAFRVTARVFSGSQPAGDAAFAALAKAGVKTIISVDGTRPDVEAARRHGLRYIHLPFGYDGIPAERICGLAKAAAEAPGPIFIHCHHGKHRGPAAAAILCEAGAGWTPARAEAWLRQAGTADDYPGLYRAVREFRMPEKEQMLRIGPLQETVKTPGLVDAMVAIDARLDALEGAAWKAPAAREATLLWEHFRELARMPDTAGRPAAYRERLADAADAAAAMRELLRTGTPDAAALETALQATKRSCTECHKAFRNGNQ
jgi:protein tyrosine phosphatase (PTP) superfamily phosphohydrolase (DUF442 family)/cytochrome c556